MNRERLDKLCERGILGLVLAILIFGPLAMGAVEIQYFLVIQALTLCAMVLWCARLWISPRPVLLWPPISWAVLAFTGYAISRYFTADLEHIARLEIIRILVYAFLFLIILNNLYRQEHIQIVTLVLVFLAMLISFYALYQFISGSQKVWGFETPYRHRGSGTYISPNNLAGFLEMILPLSLAWLLVSRVRAVTKVFVGYASLMILAGIAVTVSRGSWISVALVLVIFFGLMTTHRTYRLPSILLLVILAGAALYFIPRTTFFQSRWKEFTANDEFNDSARSDLWKPAVRMWRENVWWGIGPDHFNYRFRAFRPQTEQLEPDRVHNDYLNTLTDWGIVGIGLVGVACALLFAGIAKTWRGVGGMPGGLGGGQSNKFAALLGGSLGLLAIFFHSFVDFNMHIPANAILAVSLMALISTLLRFATEEYWFGVRAGTRMALTVALLAGGAYLTWQGVRAAREFHWQRQAAQAGDSYGARAEALQKAFALEPTNFKTAYEIGKTFRARSLQGWANAEELNAKAMEWFARSAKLNPYHGYSFMEYGLCLDWLGKTEEAQSWFEKAVRLDPNGYFTAANMGFHYLQAGDYAAAKTWFERSKRLEWHGKGNQIVETCLPIAMERLLEAATRTNRLVPPPLPPL